MEKQLGPESLSVISQVSAVEGCPLKAGFHCMLNPTICYKTGFEIHEQVKTTNYNKFRFFAKIR